MDENVSHSTRRYWNYDPTKGPSGINFTTGIDLMTIPSIAKVHVKLSDMARQRIWRNWELAPLIDIERCSRGLAPGYVYGSTIGPLIATIDIPEGFAEKGKMLGGIEISSTTGEVTILPPETD